MSIDLDDLTDDKICTRLLLHPETYRTILGSVYGRNTQTVILRNRISRCIKWGKVGKVYLNGSLGSERMLYHVDKKYFILISNVMMDFHYYFCREIDKIDKNQIMLKETEELVDKNWKKIGDIVLNSWEIIKCL